MMVRVLVVADASMGVAEVAELVHAMRTRGEEVAVIHLDAAGGLSGYLRGVLRVREALRRGPRDVVRALDERSISVAELGIRLAPPGRRVPLERPV